ncbi:bifunctional (p)ppGpp synthetase/guanosine-3',5'-bis(diphosphate) 3'-pyrophosphohydrolase [Petroclostridium sp. X23]|uniref:RelA/SpoT family protein n=1 Tax=Petroclostridium sp. X23 TaxID=3045146 RepID=UPI0024ADAE78|nr:bifunctional (p)ppGpp synthetase/guanosine-3',5'-bis(diphosphate) 3'-pyrophosphohydrolase [Petroclostridium sp. X23]WHH59066.1 bifunctional (p)ppGpp synthetase/guanosine-3',5'-bis(diphosphate) 3'-pyrophosphohydrolase [Petroclostridium sp. X23]
MDQAYKKLVEKINKYNPQCDWDMLSRAYDLSKTAHEGQHRISGEPYIMHPLEVAHILADMELDCESIVAGLLHDVIEDTSHDRDEIKQMFGEQVMLLVEGVTKLGKIPYTTKEEQQVENLRKMFLAMAKDIRVILIKLADRLHNMRTLKSVPEEKQREKARETLQVYAPLAHRLGITKIKWELEDLSLRYLDPVAYYEIVESIDQKKQERDAYISSIIDAISKRLKELNIEGQIDGRSKHFYSIYRKMFAQGKGIEEIYDLFAVRVIVNSVKDCYGVLGTVHELYKPIPGRFKDYIAMPKPNMYQSLHSTVMGPTGKTFEIQIRTWDMHRTAEYGIAAHWKYKEGRAGENDLDSKLAWVRQLLEIQRDLTDAEEFMQTLKIDLFADEVFVFTPKGDVINLPAGSTPIDFAYAIHSAVGNKMMGAKVNGKIVPIEYNLKNGDIIDVLTSSSVHGPSRDWLKIAKTSQARNKINQWFKKDKRDENIARGKEQIEKELKKLGLQHNQLFKNEWVEIVLKKYSYQSIEDMYASIGHGAMTASKIISRLREEYKKTIKPEALEVLPEDTENYANTRKRKQSNNGIIVKGIDNCLVRLSRCCNPVPGDDVIGYITRGRGVSVHRRDCSNVSSEENEQNRLIEVAWEVSQNASYLSDVQILANDRVGLLVEVTNSAADSKIPLKAMNARTSKDRVAVINLTLEISDTEQLDKIIKRLRKIDGVFQVTRSRQ